MYLYILLIIAITSGLTFILTKFYNSKYYKG